MRTIRSFLSSIRCLTIGGLIAACTTSTDPTPIASIALFPGHDSIEVGGTFDGWIVVVKDASGKTLEGRQLQWESRVLSVATVDPTTGVVTGVHPGETAIIAKANGLEALSTIKVLEPVVAVVALPDSLDLPLTTSRQIAVQVIGDGGVALTNRAVSFSSDDLSTVVVNGSGVLTPLKLGTTSIRVRVSGVVKATVRVRVVGEPVTSVRITPQQSVQIVRVGQTRQLSAECFNASGQLVTGRPLVWNSTNPVIAGVDESGLVNAVSLGSVAIIVTCDNTASASVNITVTPVPVASVSIDPPSLTVRIGTQAQLNAFPKDSAGKDLTLQGRSILWETNNLPVATITQTGLVGGNGNGTAEIRVTVDGIRSGPATITVFTPGFALLPGPPPAWLTSRRTVDDPR